MDRKDKTSYVFKLFIGDIIFKGLNTEKHIVEVRIIHYTNNDEEFNKIETDNRGNTLYSSMIVKLCDYIPRCILLVKIIDNLMKENPLNQIMLLSHNRSLLTYLYENINEKKIGTVGYYVGGMKNQHLKETETKQIILATYSMAAEALDIKTLNTLILATPKTDIVQSTGRILRTQYSDKLIVDIVDTHTIFKNQYSKRKCYYKKCEYTIKEINHSDYLSNNKTIANKWNTVFTPNTNSGIKTQNKPVCLISKHNPITL
jgi:hypothetical protein